MRDALVKINSLLDSANRFELGGSENLALEVWHYPVEGFPSANPVARTLLPYIGSIAIPSEDGVDLIDSTTLQTVLEEQAKVEEYTTKAILPRLAPLDFQSKLLLLIHDFALYSRQHPEVLNKLHEEHLRDIYLIMLKVIWETASSETFHYDGKLDFKITNPENKYEIVTGEFKWWSGELSFKEAFYQAVRKHCSGQESHIYIVICNRNKDILGVFEKIKSLVALEPEYAGESDHARVPEGSREHVLGCLIQGRSRIIPMTIVILDLYHRTT